MVLPQSQLQCLWITIIGMLFLACWVHAYFVSGKWRFELFYVDLAIGFAAAGVIYAFTLGNLGFDGFDFMDDLGHAAPRSILFAGIAGGMLNLGTILLVASSSIAGVAVSFLIGLGLAIIGGSGIALLVRGGGSWPYALAAILLAIGGALVLAIAYSRLVQLRRLEIPKNAQGRPAYRISAWKGLILAAVAAVPLGLYAPVLARARRPEVGLGPYGVGAVIAFAVLGSSVLFNLFFMNLPIEGEPVEVRDYVRAGVKKHLMGLLAGMIWFSGLLALLVVSEPSSPAQVNGVVFAWAQAGVPLIAAALGLLLWKEFRGATGAIRGMVLLTFVLMTAGAALIAFAPAARPGA